jgi:hypothetical protein
MRTRDIKALNETIASVVDPADADRAKALQEGYLNSLTEKARQICEETIEEKAATGMEDWASDPKVKASFKKQYGKRWKEVMYGRSWNLAKKEKELGVNEEAELDLAEGVSAKRMRIIRKHNVSGKPIKGEVADFMQRSFKKKFYKDKEKFGGATPAVLGRARLKHSAMKAKGLAEAEQLDEAGYKKLMRLKKKAYNTRNPKVVRATAELEAKVAANMARRGRASPDAIRAGGSRIGKSGKYTQKAGQLANQRDRALAKFRGRAVAGGAFNPPGPEKRKRQQAQAEFSNRARSGDFGQNNQEGMRPRYNYLKRTGKLKTYK